MDTPDRALLELGLALQAAGYRFITVTPETHRRVVARPRWALARDARDVFGWSCPFERALLPAAWFAHLEAADALEPLPSQRFRSRVRYSSLAQGLYVHSAFPTEEADAVFFGPDTYRFVNLLARTPGRFRRVVDIGCGSGAGGLSLAGRADELVLTDVNPRALRFASVNAALNRVDHVQLVRSDVLAQVEGSMDLVIANPPYLTDAGERTYRHGGGAYGTELSERITRESLQRLTPGGRLVLYTGAPVVEGEDQLFAALRPLIESAHAEARFEELDPDVFGEELELGPYADVERIAVVAVTARRALSV